MLAYQSQLWEADFLCWAKIRPRKIKWETQTTGEIVTGRDGQ